MLIDEGLLSEDFVSSYGKQSQLKLDEDYRDFVERLRCNFLKFKAHLFRLDLRANLDSKQKPYRRMPSLSMFLNLFYIYCTIKLTVATYYHFVLDYQRYKLDKFDQLLYYHKEDNHMLAPAQIRHREEAREQLVHEYEEARQTLKRIGAPYLNFPFIAGMAKMALVLASSVTYLLMHLYYRYWKPFDYSIAYTLIAPERLQAATETIIRDQVNKFIISCRIYNEQLVDQETSECILMEWQKDLLKGELRSAERRENQYDRSAGSEYDNDDDYFGQHITHGNSLIIRTLLSRIVSNHKFLVQQVRSMAIDGMLQPFNRRRLWLVNLSLAHIFTEVVSLIIVAAWLVYMLLILPFTQLLLYELETDLLDIIFHCEHCLYGVAGFLADTFYLSLTALTCLDQVHIVSRLNDLIENTILDNTHKLKDFLYDEMRVYRSPFCKRKFSLDEFTQTFVLRCPKRSIRFVAAQSTLRAFATSPIEECENGLCKSLVCAGKNSMDIERSINLSLMYTLMHYKIFVTQLKPALDSLPVFATLLLLLTFLFPAITRLLIAYLDTKRKGASLVFCILVLTGSDIAFVMIDRLHARCMIIYRRLQSLMAHIVAMDHIVKLQTGREAYDKHLVWMLRKELNHPERLTDQFATRMILTQSSMTYASLIKYHFWWGVLAISIFVLDPTLPNASDIFGGVWRFYGFADGHLNDLLFPPKGNNTIA